MAHRDTSSHPGLILVSALSAKSLTLSMPSSTPCQAGHAGLTLQTTAWLSHTHADTLMHSSAVPSWSSDTPHVRLQKAAACQTHYRHQTTHTEYHAHMQPTHKGHSHCMPGLQIMPSLSCCMPCPLVICHTTSSPTYAREHSLR
jgi:hypothetical protein